MEKKKNGRPEKYKPEYCKKMIEFFSIEPNKVTKVITNGKNDYYKEEEKLIPNDLPTFEKFAQLLDVSVDSMMRWRDKHKKFRVAYEKCKAMQKHILVVNGLSGLYASNFAIFVATNFTEMRSKNETDVTSGGQPIPILGGASVHKNNSDK